MQASGGGSPSFDSIAAAARGDAMRRFVVERIRDAGGAIGFAEYMHHALYAPGLGYYVGGAMPFGDDGDFVTAPEVSALFGRTLARIVADILEQIDAATVVELGAGSGALAAALVDWFSEHGRPLDYRILDVSPALVDSQRRRLGAMSLPDDVRVDWVPEPTEPLRGVVIANEVADALPVERFAIDADGTVLQVCVTVSARGDLELVERPAPRPLREAVRRIERSIGHELAAGYRSEVCLALSDWVRRIADWLAAGALVIGDYGVGRAEYYAPERRDGTFLCHAGHRAHDDPLAAPGLTDMTAWVDFTSIAEAGTAAGLSVVGFTPQAPFLLHGGLATEFEQAFKREPARQAALAAEVRTLTLPGEMGERFRFLGLGRGIMRPVAAFGGTDLRHTL